MTTMTSTRLTQAARDKAVESTGIDPGEWLYRLHRDTCDRQTGDLVEDVDVVLAQHPERVAAAKQCSRCKIAEAPALIEQAQAVLNEQAPTGGPTGTATAPETVAQGVAQGQGAVPVYAGPAVTYGADGRILGLRPSVYPEVQEGPKEAPVTLWCAAHHTDHAASNFAFVTKRGDGKGRMVECRKAQVERLERNAARPAGTDKERAPHLPADRVVSKA